MHYFSTNRLSPEATFREAVLRGQPDDKGLYFPSEIPHLSDDWIGQLPDTSNVQIAFDVIRPFVGDDIDEYRLFEICSETVDFPFPLVPITDRISVLELFHGPTLAFKDVGARFMSRCLQHFTRHQNGKTVVVVATSGDTGGAVAAGFFGLKGIEVVILYPKGKVSRVQELQLTALGGNVTTLELRGTFDDCQSLAKQALADADLQSRGHFTSANSINIARWLPQQFYYFFALKQWDGPPPVISVPSGNFGNLASGILARVSGLPAHGFIAACNANDVVPRFMQTEDYKPRPSVATLSNAMDVGSPSNFVRVLELFDNKFIDLKEVMKAVSVSDETTVDTMREVYNTSGYVLDPHGAVGYRALADHLMAKGKGSGFFLETAHPVKFDSVTQVLGDVVEVPDAVRAVSAREKHSIEMDVNYDDLRDLLVSKL